ncbi:MAG: hypothetical protein ACJ75T_04570 [Solirubrobacterales bacterium]
MAGSGDTEIAAIEQVIEALDPLDDDARSRVLEYAFKRLGIVETATQPSAAPESAVPDPPTEDQGPLMGAPTDIRSLREEKQPKSANEMAAVVGYYLAEVAPPSERRTEIGTSDIEKYFKQAQHPLPEAPGRTLINAAAAGYFDKVQRGLYSLNPVGHNLVAHGLPRSNTVSSPSRPKRAKPAGKKRKAPQSGAKRKSKSKRKK